MTYRSKRWRQFDHGLFFEQVYQLELQRDLERAGRQPQGIEGVRLPPNEFHRQVIRFMRDALQEGPLPLIISVHPRVLTGIRCILGCRTAKYLVIQLDGQVIDLFLGPHQLPMNIIEYEYGPTPWVVDPAPQADEFGAS